MIIMSQFHVGKVRDDSDHMSLALGYMEHAKALLQSITQKYSRVLDKEMNKIVKNYQSESNDLYNQYMRDNVVYVCTEMG